MFGREYVQESVGDEIVMGEKLFRCESSRPPQYTPPYRFPSSITSISTHLTNHQHTPHPHSSIRNPSAYSSCRTLRRISPLTFLYSPQHCFDCHSSIHLPSIHFNLPSCLIHWATYFPCKHPLLHTFRIPSHLSFTCQNRLWSTWSKNAWWASNEKAWKERNLWQRKSSMTGRLTKNIWTDRRIRCKQQNDPKVQYLNTSLTEGWKWRYKEISETGQYFLREERKKIIVQKSKCRINA